MRRLIWNMILPAAAAVCLGLVVGLALKAEAAWDNHFVIIASVSPTSGSATSTTVAPSGSSRYVKVTCDNDAYVGNVSDSTVCTATTCDWIKFTLGEKYYSRMNGSTTKVSILCKAASCACTIWGQ